MPPVLQCFVNYCAFNSPTQKSKQHANGAKIAMGKHNSKTMNYCEHTQCRHQRTS